MWPSTGQVDCQNAVVSGNAGSGIFVSWDGLVIAFGATSHYNRSFGCYALGDSFIRAQTATVTNNGTNFNPAVNTVGNVESYIYQ